MTSKSFGSIDKLSTYIQGRFSSKTQTILLFAFNTTGKTRLANTFQDDEDNDDITSITYSALFEDMFTWDNETNEMKFRAKYSWILKAIRDEGLDARVVNNFGQYTTTRVEPVIDFEEGSISFSLATGDDTSEDNIKISRAEESLLVWSIFYTILEVAIEALQEEPENRTTEIFNNLEYIVIDDPVSSMDDTRIVSMGIDLAETIKKLESLNLKVLITTHHALFYNVMANSSIKKCKRFNLSKSVDGLVVDAQDDSPFAYHLFAKNLIHQAIDDNAIERYHFNLFRALLEKTANFLGYERFEYCLREENRKKFKRILHLNSHSKLADMEPRALSASDKDLFTVAFEQFVEDYRWKKAKDVATIPSTEELLA